MKDLLQTQSSADLKTVNNLAELSWTKRLEIQATLRQLDAKYWITKYRKIAMEEGKSEAYAWWQRTLFDLEKKRGKKNTADLQRRMNEIR
jgi:exonuclease III